jgi:hypothetical protein
MYNNDMLKPWRKEVKEWNNKKAREKFLELFLNGVNNYLFLSFG